MTTTPEKSPKSVSMLKRARKGATQLFNKEIKTMFLDSGDESEEEVVRQRIKTKRRDLSGTVIDLTDLYCPPITQEPTETPHEPLKPVSNLKELVRRFLEEYYPTELDHESCWEYFLEFFCRVYTEYPSARRCPALQLYALNFQDSPEPLQEALCREYNIKPCRINLSKANVLLSIEKRIYLRFRKLCPVSRNDIQFILPETLKAMTFDYLSHIWKNIDMIFRQPGQLSAIDSLDRDIEKLVDILFTLLDERTPKDPEVEVEQSQKVPTEPPPRAFRPPPQRLEILRDRFKNPQRQCSKQGIAEKLISNRLELSVEIETPLGWREITIHGQDIARFLNYSSDKWSKVRKILESIQSDKAEGLLTAETEILGCFCEWFRKDLEKYDKCPERPRRFYTVHEWDVHDENLIEVESEA